MNATFGKSRSESDPEREKRTGRCSFLAKYQVRIPPAHHLKKAAAKVPHRSLQMGSHSAAFPHTTRPKRGCCAQWGIHGLDQTNDNCRQHASLADPFGDFDARVPRRVVVTGLGLVTPLGIGAERVWERLVGGECGVRSITAEDLPKVSTCPGHHCSAGMLIWKLGSACLTQAC